MKKYKDIAIKAAREAGKIHKKYFRTDFKVKRKSKSYDLVTVVDIEAEETIASIIRNNFPKHNILGEESKYEKTDSEYKWIIDPLDGTNNFSNGIPIFCVSIALAKDNEIILGVVYSVVHDELFCAEKNKGAYLNGKRIKVSSADKLTDSLLITGFYYNRGEEMTETLDKVRQFFLKDVVGVRRFGSAALDLCYVGCGRATGFWEFELSPWDFAAGKLIIEEAGGRVTGENGRPLDINKKTFVVASNSKIHDKMLSILCNRRHR